MEASAPSRAIAIIPARGGSQRLPSKNLLPLRGQPVLAYSIVQALAAESVEQVYVSTEDTEIAAVAEAHGAAVVPRPLELAADQATSEAALLHVLDWRAERGLPDPELVVFLQATSPVRRPTDIDDAVETLLRERADSLFSACLDPSLLWVEEAGGPRSLNYDFRSRQREQDMGRQLRENGSIYVFRPQVLRGEGNRLGERIAMYEMDYWTSFQLDTPEDLELIEWVLGRPEYATAVAWPDPLELVVFDFDGVMTDNSVVVSGSGEEHVRCDRADGWGIARLRDAGVPMLVLSTEEHPVVAARCRKLGLEAHQGLDDKGAHLQQVLGERDIAPEAVVYVGNDVNDLACLRMVGLPVVVADAHPSVVPAAKLVLSRPGGRGAVRELCEALLARAPIARIP